MDEQEYRATYGSINPLRCVFEKSINSRQSNCQCATRFNLADREGVSCKRDNAQKRCVSFLEILRGKARFALHLKDIDSPLPHTAEIKVQNGGLRGVVSSLNAEESCLSDIDGLLEQATARWHDLESLPYEDIVREVLRYTPRRRRKKS